jgi:AcrR family transcriptional regulator
MPTRDPSATRARLLAAASREFNTKGYFGTDTNRIARRAGFAPQTFYRHFPDKIAAFLAVYDAWWQDEFGALTDALARPASAAAVARIAIAFHTDWRVFRRSLRHLAIVEPRVRKARAAARREQIARQRARSGIRRSDARMLGALLAAERLCDAVADGELDDLKLGRAAQEKLVIAAMKPLMAD